MKARLVITTFPDAEAARDIAGRCVEARLAACATLLPGVESVYRWEGKIEQAQEVVLLLKTTAERYPALEAQLKEWHPYEVPEIVALDPVAGLPAYLAWIASETS